MTDRECVEFLQWSLPRLRMRWPGFRKVRGQVCKRINHRMLDLGLADSASYRSFLEKNPNEWQVLDSFCRISISRFSRDRKVFLALLDEVLPRLIRNAKERRDDTLIIWSLGCASGEEPYTLSLLWRLGMEKDIPLPNIRIIATDSDEHLLSRARTGCYASSSLRELPAEWLERGFTRREEEYCVRDFVREGVEFILQDVRTAMPDGTFDLVLCRNVVFTYFEESLQREVLEQIKERIHPGGGLVIGAHESLPQGTTHLAPWPGAHGIFRNPVRGQVL